jgi:hypothetical protein
MNDPASPRPGSRPGGAGTMPPVSDPPSLFQAEQRRHWERGERILVEAYLAEHPALGGDPEALLDLIYSEILLREEAGETPQLEEYQRRFPALAIPLRDQFEVHRALEPAHQN